MYYLNSSEFITLIARKKRAKGDTMTFKEVTSKKFIKTIKSKSGVDLSKNIMNVHIGPFYEWDREKNKFKPAKLVITRDKKIT